MKLILITTFFFLSLFQTSPTYDVEKLKEMISGINNTELYFKGNNHSEVIDNYIEEFKKLNSILQQVDIEEPDAEKVFRQLELIYSKVSFTHQVLIDIEYTKNNLEQKYYNLWNQNFILKTKIDKIYIITRNSSTTIYVEAEPSARKTVRKKPIYESGMAIYDDLLIELKNTNQCDFESRISVLQNITLLLTNLEKIAEIKNTKELEKLLKSKSSLTSKREILLNK